MRYSELNCETDGDYRTIQIIIIFSLSIWSIFSPP